MQTSGISHHLAVAEGGERRQWRGGKSSWKEKKLDLGYVDEIVNTDACALCRPVTKAFQMSYTKPPLRTLAGETIFHPGFKR